MSEQEIYRFGAEPADLYTSGHAYPLAKPVIPCGPCGANCGSRRDTSAADLNFKSKSRTRIIELLVPLTLPKFMSMVPQRRGTSEAAPPKRFPVVLPRHARASDRRRSEESRVGAERKGRR